MSKCACAGRSPRRRAKRGLITATALLASLLLTSCLNPSSRNRSSLEKRLLEDPLTGLPIRIERKIVQAPTTEHDGALRSHRMADRYVPAFAGIAALTGASPVYLSHAAVAESGLRACAKAPSSSATGLFQFTSQTWLKEIKHHGTDIGLKRTAAAIRIGPDGIASVDDPAERARILGLRCDPIVSTAVSGALSAENSRFLSARLGRSPRSEDIYITHFLGQRGGLLLIEAAEKSPTLPASRLFPRESASNPELFYDGWRSRTVAELREVLNRRMR